MALLEILRLALAFGQGDISHKLAASIGRVYASDKFGQGESHAEGRLHRKVRGNLALDCEITWVDVPVMERKGRRLKVQVIRQWPVLLPHNLAKALVNVGLLDALIGSRKDRQEYWNHMLEEYPVLKDRVVVERTLPLAIYGDECQVFRQSVMGLHWQAILNPWSSNSMLSRFLLAAVPSEKYCVATCWQSDVLF